jgi:MFS transporter, ACS family, DAL5 transporter family protein
MLCMVLLFSIRVLLARENKRRYAEPLDDSYDDVYVLRNNEEGNRVRSRSPRFVSVLIWTLIL